MLTRFGKAFKILSYMCEKTFAVRVHSWSSLGILHRAVNTYVRYFLFIKNELQWCKQWTLQIKHCKILTLQISEVRFFIVNNDNKSGFFLATYWMGYPHAVPFSRNKIPFTPLKPSKVHIVLGDVAFQISQILKI